MKQCAHCRKFKKADNCIRCYFSERKKYKILIGEIDQAVKTTAYRDLPIVINAIIAKQPRRIFFKEELTYKCYGCNVIITKGTSMDPQAVSHGLCKKCVEKYSEETKLSFIGSETAIK